MNDVISSSLSREGVTDMCSVHMQWTKNNIQQHSIENKKNYLLITGVDVQIEHEEKKGKTILIVS